MWWLIRRKEKKKKKKAKKEKGKEKKKEKWKIKKEKERRKEPEMGRNVQKAILRNKDPLVWQCSFIFMRFISLKLP